MAHAAISRRSLQGGRHSCFREHAMYLVGGNPYQPSAPPGVLRGVVIPALRMALVSADPVEQSHAAGAMKYLLEIRPEARSFLQARTVSGSKTARPLDDIALDRMRQLAENDQSPGYVFKALVDELDLPMGLAQARLLETRRRRLPEVINLNMADYGLRQMTAAHLSSRSRSYGASPKYEDLEHPFTYIAGAARGVVAVDRLGEPAGQRQVIEYLVGEIVKATVNAATSDLIGHSTQGAALRQHLEFCIAAQVEAHPKAWSGPSAFGPTLDEF